MVARWSVLRVVRKPMSAAFYQYLLATMAAISLIAVQVAHIMTRLGLGSGSINGDLMQRQIAAHLLSDPTIVLGAIGFSVLVLLSHLLIMVGAVAVFRIACGRLCHLRRESIFTCAVFLALTSLSAMMANQWLYPSSDAFRFADLLLVQGLSPVLIAALAVVIGGLVVVAAFDVLQTCARSATTAVLTLALIGVAWFVAGEVPSSKASAGSRAMPDVIVLGVDSLRPDFLPAFGGFPSRLTPIIDQQLRNSVVMQDARTPLARTFVSYSSFLTGRNPVGHGIRFNLYPRAEINRDQSIAWILKRRGYQTMLAMDESRFANFDGSFGFDKVIGPTQGALDFAVGGAFDFMGTNLMMAALPPITGLSPIQGNRAAHRTYRSDVHPERVKEYIRTLKPDRPLFIVSHLCLPHWPYLPSSVGGDDLSNWIKGVEGYEDAPAQYLRAMQVADAQFGEILQELKVRGRLNNAIVIVMSDHGEDFNLRRDRLHSLDFGPQEVGYFGHGNFALSEAQNRVVMSIQRYRDGVPLWSPRELQGSVSVIDAMPTVLDMLGEEKIVRGLEGISWKSALESGKDLSADRIRYFENGIRSAGVEQANIDERAVAGEMSYLYQVTPDMRFEIRPELLPTKLAEKQRGASLGQFGVFTDPVTSLSATRAQCWKAVDYRERTIGCVEFPATDPAVARLQFAVCDHFQADGQFVAAWCRVREGVDAQIVRQ